MWVAFRPDAFKEITRLGGKQVTAFCKQQKRLTREVHIVDVPRQGADARDLCALQTVWQRCNQRRDGAEQVAYPKRWTRQAALTVVSKTISLHRNGGVKLPAKRHAMTVVLATTVKVIRLIYAMLISIQLKLKQLNDLRWRDALELTGDVGAGLLVVVPSVPVAGDDVGHA